MTLIVLGGINEDVVAHVEALPRTGETLAARRVVRSAGGKGLNQAVAAARHGGSVRLLGAVGDDAVGKSLRALMAREGIDTTDLRIIPGRVTGQALIALAASGANTIIVDAAANADYGPDALSRATLDARVFLTQFEARPDTIAALFSCPEARAGLRILNTAPAIEAGRDLLTLADILILNESELQAFARLPHPPEGEENIAVAARALLGRADQQVIVTLGAAGCLHVDARASRVIPGHAVEAVDTVGAGDCFAGVFAAAMADGEPIEAALRRANAAAALSVSRAGAAEAPPRRQEVEAFLAAEPTGT